MIPSEKSARRAPKSDITALALMIGMILAVAVTSGATFSAAGSGALQQGLRALGFGRDTEIRAEQRKHSTALAEIERIIGRMDREIGGLTTRVARAESSETGAQESLEQLHGGLAALNADMKELRARSEAAGNEAWRKPVDHLNTAVAGTRGDIISLRSSIDAYEHMRRNDIGALSKRIERLEKTIATRDAVASIPDAPAPRAAEKPPAGGGFRGLLGLRGSGAADGGAGHVIDMSGTGH
jgi:hypothetical protein